MLFDVVSLKGEHLSLKGEHLSLKGEHTGGGLSLHLCLEGRPPFLEGRAHRGALPSRKGALPSRKLKQHQTTSSFSCCSSPSKEGTAAVSVPAVGADPQQQASDTPSGVALSTPSPYSLVRNFRKMMIFVVISDTVTL